VDKLLDKISSRMDLPRGARYIFSMDGDRKTSLDELEDGSSYVVSSFKQFKVSVRNKYMNLCAYKRKEKKIVQFYFQLCNVS
jgi:microtubule-associated protein-like 1/2